MSAMTMPEAWFNQDRMLTVDDMEDLPGRPDRKASALMGAR